MEQEAVMAFLDKYGLIFVYLIVTMEYMNFPFLPAAVVFPSIGIWANISGTPFLLASLVCVAGGMTGGTISYYIGYTGGNALVGWFFKKFKKARPLYEKFEAVVDKNGSWIIFIGRIIPTVRTLLGYFAGSLRLNFWSFSFFSALGIAVNNLLYMAAGVGIGNLIW